MYFLSLDFIEKILDTLVSIGASIIVVELLIYLTAKWFVYYVSPSDNSPDNK
jgi:hypothetical protein